MENTKKKIAENIGQLFASIIFWFISAGFIMWGWNTLAPHLNAPIFNYWEIFAIRMGVSFSVKIFKQGA